MKKVSSSFFWVSFTDLMTSLFFIMLVLYVLTFLKLGIQQKATQDQLNKIQEIQAAVKELPKDYFTYEPTYKRFSLNRQIQFPQGDSKIPAEYEDYLKNVGKSIEELISKLKSKYKNENIKYLVVIEGMSSNDKYSLNYELSYQRALALARFWQANNVVFDPTYTELQISGSGIGGLGRFDGTSEHKNQRFLIQIVPKIGDIG